MSMNNYNYLVNIITPKAEGYKRKVEVLLREEFGECSGYATSERIDLSGDTYIPDSDSEEEAHERMVKLITAVLGKVTVTTQWTSLEPRQYNEYTTEVEE